MLLEVETHVIIPKALAPIVQSFLVIAKHITTESRQMHESDSARLGRVNCYS